MLVELRCCSKKQNRGRARGTQRTETNYDTRLRPFDRAVATGLPQKHRPLSQVSRGFGEECAGGRRRMRANRCGYVDQRYSASNSGSPAHVRLQDSRHCWRGSKRALDGALNVLPPALQLFLELTEREGEEAFNFSLRLAGAFRAWLLNHPAANDCAIFDVSNACCETVSTCALSCSENLSRASSDGNSADASRSRKYRK